MNFIKSLADPHYGGKYNIFIKMSKFGISLEASHACFLNYVKLYELHVDCVCRCEQANLG